MAPLPRLWWGRAAAGLLGLVESVEADKKAREAAAQARVVALFLATFWETSEARLHAAGGYLAASSHAAAERARPRLIECSERAAQATLWTADACEAVARPAWRAVRWHVERQIERRVKPRLRRARAAAAARCERVGTWVQILVLTRGLALFIPPSKDTATHAHNGGEGPRSETAAEL